MKLTVTALAVFAALPTFIDARPTHAASASDATKTAGVGPASALAGTTKQLAGGAILRLAPGTVIAMGRPIKLQLASGYPETVTQVVKLITGRVDIDIPMSKVPKTAVLVQAARKVNAVAKGGHSIAIADANRVTFAAVNGDMVAASRDDWKVLPSGLVRSFTGNDPAYEQHSVPGVPTLSISRPLLLAFGDPVPSTRVDANGVKEAHHYQLSIWRVAENGNELVRRLDSPGTSTEISGLSAGQYQITSRAVDSSGVFGQDSAARALRVVGADLPPGARYEDGAIVLGTRNRVKLLGVKGLEASYGASSDFVSAPDSVGLFRGERTVLRLREPGTTQELRVGLEPRVLRADVEITPKHARWPQDMIEVTVHLFDARGRAVTEAVAAKPTVLIDVQPAQVTWMRSGNLMHTFIPVPTTRGPWVVRVEVSDEFGDPAGRDFMEIAGPDNDRVSAR